MMHALSEFMDAAPTWAILADIAAKGTLVLTAAAAFDAVARRSSAALRHLAWAGAMAALLVLPALSVIAPSPVVIGLLPSGETAPQKAAAIGDRPTLSVPDRLDYAAPEARAADSRDANPRARAASSDRPAAPAAVPPRAFPAGWRESDEAREVAAKVSPKPGKPERARADRGAAAAARSIDVSRFPAPDTAASLQTHTLILLLFPVVALLLGLHVLLGHAVAAWRLRRVTERVDDDWQASIRDAAERLGLRRAPTVLLGPTGAAPVVVCLPRARVLLPREALDWDAPTRRAALLHEFGHVRRRDCLSGLAAQVALALNWFNPLAWLAATRIHQLREEACDDLVLSTGEDSRDYAEALVTVARGLRRGRVWSVGELSLARPRALEKRVLAILKTSRNFGRLRAPAVAAVCVGLAVLLLTGYWVRLGVASPDETAPAETPPAVDAAPSSPTHTPAPNPKSAAASNEEVAVPDPVLEQAVRRAAGVTSGPLHVGDLAKVEYINLPSAVGQYGKLTGVPYVKSLEGLEHCDNLKSIGLGASPEINDLSPLRELRNLEALHTNRCPVRDISPIADNESLTLLLADGCPIESLEPLRRMPRLGVLEIGGNTIRDLAPLADLKRLVRLGISSPHPLDLSPLEGLEQLRFLTIVTPGELDISPLVANQGLGKDDEVTIRDAALSSEGKEQLQALRERGVEVRWTPHVVTRLDEVIPSVIDQGRVQLGRVTGENLPWKGAPVKLTTLGVGAPAVEVTVNATSVIGFRMDARQARPGFYDLLFEGRETSITLPDAIEVRAVEPPPPSYYGPTRTLTGTLLDPDGRPVANETVCLVGMGRRNRVRPEEARTNPEFQRRTDDEGRFQFTFQNAQASLGWGDWYLVVFPDEDHAGAVSGRILQPTTQTLHREDEIRAAGNPDNEPVSHEWANEWGPVLWFSGKSLDLLLQLRRGVDVHGRNTQPEGEPLEGTTVTLWQDLHMAGHTGYGGEIFERSAVTDAEGRFEFRKVYPATFELRARSLSWLETRTSAEGKWQKGMLNHFGVSDSATSLTIGIRGYVGPHYEVSGLVRDRASGEPVHRANVTIFYATTPDTVGVMHVYPFASTGTGEDGRYRVMLSTPWIRGVAVRRVGYKNQSVGLNAKGLPGEELGPGEYDFMLPPLHPPPGPTPPATPTPPPAREIETASDEPVSIPDPVLEEAVRKAIGVTSGPLKIAHLSALRELHVPDPGLPFDPTRQNPPTPPDLSWLQYCENLEQLSLQTIGIRDLTPFASLKHLTSLNLRGNPVHDLSPLANCTNLRVLILDDCPVSQLAPLASLPQLRGLSLNGTQIASVDDLADFPKLSSVLLNETALQRLKSLLDLASLKHASIYQTPLDARGRREMEELRARGVRVTWSPPPPPPHLSRLDPATIEQGRTADPVQLHGANLYYIKRRGLEQLQAKPKIVTGRFRDPLAPGLRAPDFAAPYGESVHAPPSARDAAPVTHDSLTVRIDARYADPGNYDLEANLWGTTLTLPGALTVLPVDAETETWYGPHRSIEGVLIDSDGRPKPDTEVYLAGLNNTGLPVTPWDAARLPAWHRRTDADGRFRFVLDNAGRGVLPEDPLTTPGWGTFYLVVRPTEQHAGAVSPPIVNVSNHYLNVFNDWLADPERRGPAPSSVRFENDDFCLALRSRRLPVTLRIPESIRVEGVITDKTDGKPIVGTTVTLSNSLFSPFESILRGGFLKQTTLTDQNGRYEFPRAYPQRPRLSARSIGEGEGRLDANEEWQPLYNLSLDPEPGDESITVDIRVDIRIFRSLDVSPPMHFALGAPGVERGANVVHYLAPGDAGRFEPDSPRINSGANSIRVRFENKPTPTPGPAGQGGKWIAGELPGIEIPDGATSMHITLRGPEGFPYKVTGMVTDEKTGEPLFLPRVDVFYYAEDPEEQGYDKYCGNGTWQTGGTDGRYVVHLRNPWIHRIEASCRGYESRSIGLGENIGPDDLLELGERNFALTPIEPTPTAVPW